jgi:hypothetical protein
MGLCKVGVAGFEPATLWSQTRCANRAALHPVLSAVALVKADKIRSQKYHYFFNIKQADDVLNVFTLVSD